MNNEILYISEAHPIRLKKNKQTKLVDKNPCVMNM